MRADQAMALSVLRFVPIGSNSGAYGGLFQSARAHTRMLTQRGSSVELVYSYLRGDKPAVFVGEEAYPALRVAPTPGFTSVLSIQCLQAVLRKLSRCDVAIIDLSREVMPLVVCAMTLLKGVPLVVQTHGMLSAKRGAAYRAIDKLIAAILRRASLAIALNVDEERDLISRGSPEGRVLVMGNAVPTELATTPPRSP